MKREDVWAFLQRTLAGFGSLALAILFYFTMLRFDSLWRYVGRLAAIMMPFIYGGVMAYLLRIPCNFFEKMLKKYLPEKTSKHADGLAVLLVLLITGLALYLLLAMIIPELFASITKLTAILPGQINRLTLWLEEKTAGNPTIQSYVTQFVNTAGDTLRAWSKQDLLPVLSSMMGRVGTVFTTIYNIGIGFIVCIYLLLSRKKFARQSKGVVYGLFKPQTADLIVKEIHFVDHTFVGFFGGKVLDSAIVGAICYVFCFIMSFVAGYPNVMLVSVIVAITNMIPYFGPYIGAVPGALLIAISNPINGVVFFIFIMIIQQIDGNVIGPMLLADSVGLSGFWVLFAITLFGGIFGFTGVLIGVPVFAVIYDVLKRYIIRGLEQHGKMDVLKTGEV